MTDHNRAVPKSIIRRRELERRTGLSRSSIYERLDPKDRQYDPQFPRPFKLGRGPSIGWLDAEVEAWIQAKVDARDGGAQ